MPTLRSTAAGARLGALLGIAALALHQLRYLVAQGTVADEAVAARGHGYLELFAPVAASLCVAIVAGQLLVAASRRTPAPAPGPRVLRPTSLAALALVVIFSIQELVEGALSSGHPAGIDALLSDRGWVVLPIALALGAGVTMMCSEIGRLEQQVAGTLASSRLPDRRQPELLYEQPSVAALASLGLVFGFSRRPPPSIPVR
jgi:hypothetical protein